MQTAEKYQPRTGLRTSEIAVLQKEFGKNIFSSGKSESFFVIVWNTVKEPMFLLLLFSCMLYFILGETKQGILMLFAMGFVAAISFYQEIKSTVALKALTDLTDPQVCVIRDGAETKIHSEELLPGDILLLEEGSKIPADAVVLESNDLTVNESILTGESVPVEKNLEEGHNLLYQGTLINTGKLHARVTATGSKTALGKLGKEVMSVPSSRTKLQIQINGFVRRLAVFGFFGFLVIWIVNFLHNGDWVQSLLLGLTLAMSAIPEEIPVAFSSFMALGAFHLAKKGIITRQPATIESLGEVTVICLDKTGTITKNKMEVKNIYDYRSDQVFDIQSLSGNPPLDVLSHALLASEVNPFDAMEIAIVDVYRKLTDGELLKNPLKMVAEYPLAGRPPMMTHVYQTNDRKIVAAKGAPEKIIQVCKLPVEAIRKINIYAQAMAKQGYRLLGVASSSHHKNKPLPPDQDEFEWSFTGVVALYDPPKENARAVLKRLSKAGIKVKLLTGDYPETAMSIAEQTGFEQAGKFLTGEQVMQLTDDQLKSKVNETTIYVRMFPEAKLKVIKALISNGETTAMSGDGVNDGPALKSADIGIAMGQRGSEIARQAASLVLTDDNLEKIVEAIYQGRKIYANLIKATRYIVSIHIPIILIASLPVLLGWRYPNIFTPIHVIFLELIMGPTCSIFFEREPIEEDTMSKPFRKRSALFERKELIISLIQGGVIAAAILGLYHNFMIQEAGLAYTRSMVFTTLIIANVLLTLVNRSFTVTILKTIQYKNTLAYFIIALSLLFLSAIHFITPIRNLFGLVPIRWEDFALSFVVGFASVMWFEIYKAIKQ